ncbi:uncharacterized protein TNCV_2672711 [Trichonephila clavipes]|nr:uncharacterized protein TNCV_2672711 [Trichonephila clavipes]
MANRCFNGIPEYMKSNLIKRKTKVLLYKSLLRSVLTYVCETWFMSRTDEISIYERKILRSIFGGIQENGTWRRRSNLELYRSYKEFDIVNFIKIQPIKWAGYVTRMNEDCITKKSLQCSTNRHTKKGQAKSQMD